MAWIQLVEPDDAEGKLKELYDGTAQAGGGNIGPMIRAGSLNPDALEGRMKVYRGLMYGRASSLSRAEARDDRGRDLGHQWVPLLNRLTRRGSPCPDERRRSRRCAHEKPSTRLTR